MALTIAEVVQEMQVPLATRLRVPCNPFYAIGGKPPTSDSMPFRDRKSAPAAQPPECQRATNIH
jgi:hypothetical protein